MILKEEAIGRLSDYNIRPLVQRVQVMQFLMENKIHPTVEEIYNALSAENPTLSKTTVYNILKLFQLHGAILALTIDEKNVRYDADISDHAHFRCSSCGKLYDFLQPEMEHKVQMGDFKVDFCHVYYRGLCPNCRN